MSKNNTPPSSPPVRPLHHLPATEMAKGTRAQVSDVAESGAERSYYRVSGTIVIDLIDGSRLELAKVKEKFASLKALSGETTQNRSEWATDGDIEKMLQGFIDDSFEMQFLFQFTLNNPKSPAGACWIDHAQNPRVIAVLNKGNNEVDYYSLPECKRLERNYWQDLKETKGESHISIAPPKEVYWIPNLRHVGTELLPWIQKALRTRIITDQLSVYRIEVALANAAVDLLENKPIRMNQDLFEGLLRATKTESLIQALNSLLKNSPYQLVRKEENSRAAA